MKPRIPSYRLHRPTRQAVVTLDGHDHYLGRHDTEASRAAYERLIAGWLANGRKLPDPGAERRPLTIAELCDGFLSWCEHEYRTSDGSISRGVRNVKIALRPLIQNMPRMPAADFGPKALKLYRQQQIDAGLTRKTVNERVGIVRRAFRWATGEELVPPATFHALQAVRGLTRGRCGAREGEGVHPVPEAHIEKALPHMPPPVRAMVELQLLCACRPGEIVSLCLSDIDRTGEVWLWRPPRHKNAWRGHKRIIAIGPQGQEILRRFLRPGVGDAPLFSPAEAERQRLAEQRRRRRTPLWPSHLRAQAEAKKRRPRRRLGDSYSVPTYHRAIARACAKASVPTWSPGRLRHNAATLARRRYGLEAAAALLGHRRVETTQIYSETSLALAVKVAGECG